MSILMNSIIVIILILEFHVDISELYEEFDYFEEDNIFGIGRDLSLHYRLVVIV